MICVIDSSRSGGEALEVERRWRAAEEVAAERHVWAEDINVLTFS